MAIAIVGDGSGDNSGNAISPLSPIEKGGNPLFSLCVVKEPPAPPLAWQKPIASDLFLFVKKIQNLKLQNLQDYTIFKI